MSARAGIVVTGTEVLTGRVADRNGPWIADRLLELGVELAHITICGDRPADIAAQLRFLAGEGVDLIVTSGGLGPTADDMTVEVVARFCGRELVLDDELEKKIADILKRLMARRFTDVGLRRGRGPPTASRPWCPPVHRSSTRWAPRPAWWCPGKPTVHRAAGPAARAAADVAHRRADPAAAGGDRRPDRSTGRT